MVFEFEKLVVAPREAVFTFHATPGNLGLLFPAWQPSRVFHDSGHVRRGDLVWLEVGVARCIPLVLGFRHATYEPPRRFSEELIHGPFARFDHIHEFDEHSAGTIVRDRLDIRLPGQYGGEVAMRWVVAPRIRELFAYRHQVLDVLAANGFGSSGGESE